MTEYSPIVRHTLPHIHVSSPFPHIPEDIHEHIGMFLTSADVLMLRATCKYFFELSAVAHATWSALFDAAYDCNLAVYQEIDTYEWILRSDDDYNDWLRTRNLLCTELQNPADLAVCKTNNLAEWKPLISDNAVVVAAYAGRQDIVDELMYTTPMVLQHSVVDATLHRGEFGAMTYLTSHDNFQLQFAVYVPGESLQPNQFYLSEMWVEWVLSDDLSYSLDWLLWKNVNLDQIFFVDSLDACSVDVVKIVYKHIPYYFDLNTLMYGIVANNRHDIFEWADTEGVDFWDCGGWGVMSDPEIQATKEWMYPGMSEEEIQSTKLMGYTARW